MIWQPRAGRPQKTHIGRKKQPLKSRELLMDAVLALTQEKDFFSISLREVSRESGMSPANFYRYFGTMEDLAVAIIDDTFNTLRPLLQRARSRASLEKLHGEKTINSIFRLIQTYPDNYRFLINIFDSSSTKIRESIDEHWVLILNDLKQDLREANSVERMSDEAIDLAANILSKAALNIASEIVIRTKTDKEKRRIKKRGASELRMIYMGALNWRSFN